MTRAFYNDNDPYVCAWLQNLMVDGLGPVSRIGALRARAMRLFPE